MNDKIKKDRHYYDTTDTGIHVTGETNPYKKQPSKESNNLNLKKEFMDTFYDNEIHVPSYELWTWFESKLNEVREDSDKKVLKVAGVKLDGLEPEDIKVIADVLLMRKSRKLKPAKNNLILYGVRFVESKKVKPNEIKVSGNLKSKSGGKELKTE